MAKTTMATKKVATKPVMTLTKKKKPTAEFTKKQQKTGFPKTGKTKMC